MINDRELVIEVADHGVGIAPELRDHIFTPGVTTKTHGDHGLGLHLIASYVALAKGTVEVFRQPAERDRNSRYLFQTLSFRGATSTQRKALSMQNEMINVLIVEDESELAALHAELIDKHPHLHLVGIANSLASAQRLMLEKQPQLILLDNYLPDGKGITLFGSDLLQQHACSVIFITAASDMDTCSQAIRSGAFDYIPQAGIVEAPQPLAGTLRAVQPAAARMESGPISRTSISFTSYRRAMLRWMRAAKASRKNTLELVQRLFREGEAQRCFSVDDVVSQTKLSKTTARRYLEHCVEKGLSQRRNAVRQDWPPSPLV
ncbi:Destabilizer of plasmid inheritance [Cedecea neteri]|uniref:histidine kinase n=1 Tax=Cedecea neteri TaxID=158822 RepID=A0A2X2V7L1_9ENTR|nr:Destabilizer of plasmid inheritance [Cedecea neteri]